MSKADDRALQDRAGLPQGARAASGHAGAAWGQRSRARASGSRLRGRADLSFIGLEPAEFAIYPRATHIAEKLHAYTLPRPTPNSRVRDLPDIAILASVGPIEAAEVRAALEQSFAHRATHVLPAGFPAAPARWAGPYAELAEANRLPWIDLETVERAAGAFLDPVLQGERWLWDPETWSWQELAAVLER